MTAPSFSELLEEMCERARARKAARSTPPAARADALAWLGEVNGHEPEARPPVGRAARCVWCGLRYDPSIVFVAAACQKAPPAPVPGPAGAEAAAS